VGRRHVVNVNGAENLAEVMRRKLLEDLVAVNLR
jgi:hypothetical protein